MRSLRTEFIKLKRSLSWAVVILLPVLAVVSGAMGTLASGGEFKDGWHTLWIRSIGFYGMVILPIGIAILASLLWRVEHKNGNWNALMSSPVPTVQVVLGKAAAVAVLAALMQVVLLATVILLGKLAFGLEGMLPTEYFASSTIVVVACVPVAALQSGLSTFFRSFAPPVAIALIGAGVSTVALLVGLKAAVVVPYATATYATQLGSSLVGGGNTSFDAAAISTESILLVVGAALATTMVIIASTTVLLNRSDSRA
ncbi:ABC transporter [Glutamicibacter sp. BW78]|uniref:ABC transporter permease n=1 Tax=Glutamicibacter sp. BW78 TaxID=2024403 RepID=UPI000BB7F5D9|nr:ABC transporter permease [Glutamicibacter sp. BW78]PCC26784.1 ABC transporter [Glutamicibacter sp. BW78]